jgi:hypothetical protein
VRSPEHQHAERAAAAACAAVRGQRWAEPGRRGRAMPGPRGTWLLAFLLWQLHPAVLLFTPNKRFSLSGQTFDWARSAPSLDPHAHLPLPQGRAIRPDRAPGLGHRQWRRRRAAPGRGAPRGAARQAGAAAGGGPSAGGGFRMRNVFPQAGMVLVFLRASEPCRMPTMRRPRGLRRLMLAAHGGLRRLSKSCPLPSRPAPPSTNTLCLPLPLRPLPTRLPTPGPARGGQVKALPAAAGVPRELPPRVGAAAEDGLPELALRTPGGGGWRRGQRAKGRGSQEASTLAAAVHPPRLLMGAAPCSGF